MTIRKSYLLSLLVALCLLSNAQTNCDTTLANTYLNPAGYKRLYVPTQPCSMYFYSNTAMYGIDAHRQSANLGVPQLVINNAQENSDVSAALYAQGVYNTPSSSSEVWLGITDSATNSGPSPYTWRSFAGDNNLTYFNWTAGEPNNLSPSCKVGNVCAFCFGADAYHCAYGEDCAVMNASGQWLDNTCEGDNVTRVCVLEINTCPVLIKPTDMTICSGQSVTVSATDTLGSAPYTYTWNPGGQTGQTVTITPTSTDTITVQASDRFNCIVDSTFTITIDPNAVIANAGPDIQVCPGAADTLGATASVGYTYSWSPSFGLSSTTVADPIFSIPSSPSTSIINTIYILTASANGCTASDTVNVTLYPNVSDSFTVSSAKVCGNDNLLVTYAGTASGTATYNWNFASAIVASGSGAGPYELNWLSFGPKTITLSVSNNGCTASPYSETVTVYANPTPSFSISGQTLTTTTFAGYQWLFNGQPIPGGNTQSITADTNGNYQVVVIDSNGCTDTSAIRAITNVGIQELTAQDMIHIYPNPNNGTFVVQTYRAIGGEISISDVLGRVVLKQTITSDKQSIALGTADGEYFVTIKVNGSTYTSKMIVSKE